MGKILYAGLSKDGVYPIPSNPNLPSTSCFNSIQNPTFVTVKTHHILLWHHRLGHPSSKILISTLKPVFPSISLSQIDDVCSSCEFCISAQMHRFHLNKTPLVSTLNLCIVMFGVLLHSLLYLVSITMSFLLMITPGLLGYFFSNIRVKYFLSSNTSNPWLKLSSALNLRFLGLIMVLSTLTMTLNLFVQPLVSSTNLPALTLLSKMVFQRGSIGI